MSPCGMKHPRIARFCRTHTRTLWIKKKLISFASSFIIVCRRCHRHNRTPLPVQFLFRNRFSSSATRVTIQPAKQKYRIFQAQQKNKYKMRCDWGCSIKMIWWKRHSHYAHTVRSYIVCCVFVTFVLCALVWNGQSFVNCITFWKFSYDIQLFFFLFILYFVSFSVWLCGCKNYATFGFSSFVCI